MKIELDALIFDLDGTLLDSGADIFESSNFVRQAFGQEKLSYEKIMSYVGDGVTELLQRLLPHLPAEQIQKAKEIFFEHYRAHCLEQTRPYPGVVETLSYFNKKIKAVVTNKTYWATEKILQGLGLMDAFALVLGGDSLPLRKPHPLPILHILEKFSLSPSRVLMVGDSPGDIAAGKGAEVRTCAATYGLRPVEELRKAQSDFIIDRFSDLRDLFC